MDYDVTEDITEDVTAELKGCNARIDYSLSRSRRGSYREEYTG